MNDQFTPNPERMDAPSERWLDLIIQRVTTGLSKSEQLELDHLSPSLNNQKELDRFEATATAFDLSIASVDFEVMPDDVHDRLLISAGRMLGVTATTRPVSQLERNTIGEVDDQVELPARQKTNTSIRWREVVALTVAAASLLLMLTGVNPFSRNSDSVASATDQMELLLDSRPSDLIEVSWTPVHVPSASGKVIWSDASQEGYMVFSGLDVNDPAVEQYQLWIFDNDPAQATPTDGGVFDIKASDIGPDGRAVIPIQATVPVGHAVQFAVTIETPGGVYVSERKKIPVLATVETE